MQDKQENAKQYSSDIGIDRRYDYFNFHYTQPSVRAKFNMNM
ncbi:MAG: hypothetical protein AB1489_41905 [Acidobacteriota bacterium]